MMSGRKKLVMCQACRALIEPPVKTCPLCGRDSVPRWKLFTGWLIESKYFFSMLILTINIILFALMGVVELRSGGGPEAFFKSASGAVLYDFGGFWTPGVAKGQLWRLVTPIFLHIGIIHLLFNSIALYQIGPQVEETFGSQKFILIYLVTGVVGFIASYPFNLNGAGASGAIFGLIGLLAVYGWRMRSTAGRALMRSMLIWAAIGFIYGMAIGANNAAHAGGMIAGAALGCFLTDESPARGRATHAWNAAAIACAVLITASFAMAATNYGKFQSFGEMRRLSQRIVYLEEVFIASLNWEKPEDGEPRELAARLRSAASDIDRVAHFDSRSDEIRRRLVEISTRRAELLDKAGTNSAALVAASASDYDEMNGAIEAFYGWMTEHAKEHGLF
ncbi:MAG TPA: rhomboid family intramembrane serine protease [Blastocatellia bacterium]|nr:rhomboid family intramembrane serine protease [Blastocatellia bacterium]